MSPPPATTRSPRVSSTDATLRAWAAAELAPWQAEGITAPEQALAALAASRPWTFLFRIEPDGVRCLPKPAGSGTGGAAAADRVRRYEMLFAAAARRAPGLRPITIAADLNDSPLPSAGLPVFAFQKTRGEAMPLIPDIDFLLDNTRPEWMLRDPIPWVLKRNTAVFAGSTTGGVITPEVVRTLSLPRLRAAVFFREQPRVTFRLTKLVHCDAPETETMLRALGFGGPPMRWRKQFWHRFILSMDGNGATCSRVVIALRSRSVLVKYDSDRELYYFRGLQPWVHYVPVTEDADVLRALDEAARDPARFQRIADAGRRFAAAFLSRPAIEAYAAALLTQYAALLRPPRH